MPSYWWVVRCPARRPWFSRRSGVVRDSSGDAEPQYRRERGAESGLDSGGRPKRVLLVTSALHMPRAPRTFQADLRGCCVTVLPAATDVQGLPGALDLLGRWLPDADSLRLSTWAEDEYLRTGRPAPARAVGTAEPAPEEPPARPAPPCGTPRAWAVNASRGWGAPGRSGGGCQARAAGDVPPLSMDV